MDMTNDPLGACSYGPGSASALPKRLTHSSQPDGSFVGIEWPRFAFADPEPNKAMAAPLALLVVTGETYRSGPGWRT